MLGSRSMRPDGMRRGRRSPAACRDPGSHVHNLGFCLHLRFRARETVPVVSRGCVWRAIEDRLGRVGRTA